MHGTARCRAGGSFSWWPPASYRQKDAACALAGGRRDGIDVKAYLALVIFAASRDLDVGLEVHHRPHRRTSFYLAERQVEHPFHERAARRGEHHRRFAPANGGPFGAPQELVLERGTRRLRGALDLFVR